MERVAVPLGDKSYNIYIKAGLLPNFRSYAGAADKWFVLTDHNVDRLYGDDITGAMADLAYTKYVVEAGESSKSFTTVETIIDAMVTAKLTRRSGVIAFGGGVIGDLAGFCASIYMRGIDYVQIPTTLLAQVDSSVGGKTGVNVRQGKNMAGTFYQPQTVLIDTSLLKTLPTREFIAGMGEVIKYGFIYNYNILQYVEQNLAAISGLDYSVLDPLIRRCCEIKAEVVAADEKESGLRKILNFGHTIGHALETVTNYDCYLHGEAVLVGMYHESLLAYKLNLITDAYMDQITRLISATGISVDIGRYCPEELVAAMTTDKKNSGGSISFILPTGLGAVTEQLLSPQQVSALMKN